MCKLSYEQCLCRQVSVSARGVSRRREKLLRWQSRESLDMRMAISYASVIQFDCFNDPATTLALPGTQAWLKHRHAPHTPSHHTSNTASARTYAWRRQRCPLSLPVQHPQWGKPPPPSPPQCRAWLFAPVRERDKEKAVQ